MQTWVGDPTPTALLTSEVGFKNPEICQAVYLHLEICPDTRVYQLDVALWDLLSELANAPQIAGLLNLPKSCIGLPQSISNLDGDVLILDRIQDAGNVGSILRTAAASGFTQVIAVSGCAHLWSGKVLCAGMGAHRLLDLYEGWFDSTSVERSYCAVGGRHCR